MKILIDTNIFLDFYRSNSQPVNIFNTLKEHIDRIILTDQIIQEFDRSREYVIKTLKQKFQLESKLDNFSSSYLQNLTEFKELIQLQNSYKTKQKIVVSKIDEILKDPSLDPIASFFKEFVNESLKQEKVLYTNDTIIEKAEKRKKIGNPPSSDKYSLGDEINWEIVLENIREDIVIVGRDNTYSNNFTFLQKDFHKRTGCYVTELTESITSALSKIGVITTEGLIKEEAKFIEEVKHYNEFWKHHSE
ncbi:MAG: PIN domain-containing protein [Sediminibacterium sp.]|nr:PIN domain-containing protein [Sediminibacterium sp.]